MKKLFFISLSFLYVVMSSGFTAYTHFCKGVKQGTVLFKGYDSDASCPFCSARNKQQLEKKKKGCCKDVAEVVKTDNLTKADYGFKFTAKFWGDAVPNHILREVSNIFLTSLKTEDLSCLIGREYRYGAIRFIFFIVSTGFRN